MTAGDDGEWGEDIEDQQEKNETDSNETTTFDVGGRRNNSRSHDSRNNRTWQQASPAEVLMMHKFIRQHRRQIALFEMYGNEIFHKFDLPPPGISMATDEMIGKPTNASKAEGKSESGANASFVVPDHDFDN
jgi:hypothetical protein